MRRALDQGPAAHGWDDQRWTLARIGRVITETTGVVYAAPDGVWRVLEADRLVLAGADHPRAADGDARGGRRKNVGVRKHPPHGLPRGRPAL